MAVCDRESSYTGQLTRYFDMHRRLPFEVQAFSAPDTLSDFADAHIIDLLLVSSEFINDVMEEENIRKVMMLTEEQEDVLAQKSGIACAYKYQSADKLLQKVLEYYESEYSASKESDVKGRETTFYAVYSPIKRCGKTGFSMMLGQAMSEQKRVLYMNFEEYPGFRQLFGNVEGDSSDLLLYLLQGRAGIYQKLRSLVKTIGRMDYLPPGIGHTDFRSLQWEHWERLLESIRLEGVYDAVILDLGEMPEVLFQIFAYCRKIYVPKLGDTLSEAKLKEFRWVCNNEENRDCLKRMIELEVPEEDFWELMEEGCMVQSRLYRFAAGMMDD